MKSLLSFLFHKICKISISLQDDFIALPSHSKKEDNFFDNTQIDVGLVVIEKRTTKFVNHKRPIYIKL